jgi:hypothetical protein
VTLQGTICNTRSLSLKRGVLSVRDEADFHNSDFIGDHIPCILSKTS